MTPPASRLGNPGSPGNAAGLPTGAAAHAGGAGRERPRFIAVEGPIGAGKSTLARLLAESLGARLVEEKPEENPFLGPFYADPTRNALSVQLCFLLQRYAQQADLAQEDLFAQGGVVADYLFAKDRLFATMNLPPAEFALYDRIYTTLAPRAVAPDLVVYLQARTEVLLQRISHRGRREEAPIAADYIRKVAESYAEFFFNYNDSPLLIVNASDIDIVSNPDDRRALIDVIRRTKGGINHWSRS
jgi:deoxyguanosine kinase